MTGTHELTGVVGSDDVTRAAATTFGLVPLYGHDIWLWGSQILVQNSSNVEVYGNTVYVAPESVG